MRLSEYSFLLLKESVRLKKLLDGLSTGRLDTVRKRRGTLVIRIPHDDRYLYTIYRMQLWWETHHNAFHIATNTLFIIRFFLISAGLKKYFRNATITFISWSKVILCSIDWLFDMILELSVDQKLLSHSQDNLSRTTGLINKNITRDT